MLTLLFLPGAILKIISTPCVLIVPLALRVFYILCLVSWILEPDHLLNYFKISKYFKFNEPTDKTSSIRWDPDCTMPRINKCSMRFYANHEMLSCKHFFIEKILIIFFCCFPVSEIDPKLAK